MRINKYVANATGVSRRKADDLITHGQVYINENKAQLGDSVEVSDKVYLDNKLIELNQDTVVLMINKPRGYVCSRSGQGSKTIYELIPDQYKNLKPVGRLDKDSSGLLLLTNNGDLANKLTHPKYAKQKTYVVQLDKNLSLEDSENIKKGIKLEDGISKFDLDYLDTRDHLLIKLSEGRNRQIRRTFEKLNYKVISLHRETMGEYSLGRLRVGEVQEMKA
jgi:23S rRNA pseudouridine2605 synthase